MWTMRPASQPPTVLGPVNLLLSASGFSELVSLCIPENVLFFTANFSAPLIAENIILSFQCGHGPELAVLWKACQEIM